MIRLDLARLGLDPNSGRAVVILKEEDGDRYLPIDIGPFEAQSISMAVEGITISRPLTHDLLLSIITSFGAKLTQVLIDDLKDHTFYAQLTMDVGDDGGRRTIEVDARPSDAIALALRARAPVYTLEKVLLQAGIRAESGDLDADEDGMEGAEPENGEAPGDEPDAANGGSGPAGDRDPGGEPH